MDSIRLTKSVEALLRGAITIEQLAVELRSHPELTIFDNKVQWKGGSGVTLSMRSLAEWLENRGRQIGARRIVADLERYVNEPEIPYEEILVLAGVEVTDSIQLSEGIEILPFSGLDAHLWKDQVEEFFGKSWANYRPSVALRRRISHPRVHLLDVGASKKPRWDFRFQALDDVRLCITAIGPHAPLYLGSWIQPEKWVPNLGGDSAQIPEPLNVGNYPRSIAKDLSKLPELHGKWIALSEKERKHLRVALKRINSGLRRNEIVDSAIDLGIAMEAVFLSDKEPEQGELGFTLRLRAARYLQGDSVSRQKMSKTFSRLYGYRSKAVHSGELDEMTRDLPTEDILGEGYKLMCQAILRIIEEGEPDWSAMIFQ